jgi:uncharacterized protein (DUF1501 family)
VVVLELTGGNDGLNTVIPYTNDQYYKMRPTLAIQKDRALKVNDEFGFHPNLLGFEYLFKQGQMAVAHGCSYPKPNRSHFESMGFWHTGVPNGADSRGWVGRFADAHSPQPKQSYIINIAKEQSMAVKSGVHAPVVFSDDEGDLKMMTDFRSVYATMIKEWMGYEDTKTILKGDFPTLGVFA